MQSNIFAPGMGVLTGPQKHFDTSGKSPAQLHHRAICKNACRLARRQLRRDHS
jgi:hypothetical protein